MDFPPSHGGIQTMAREILGRASRTTFHVIAPRDDGTRTDGVTTVRAIGPGKRGFIVPLAIAARRHIRASKPEVVLSLHALAAPGVLLGGGPPLVLVCHGGELRSRRIARVARWAFPRAARVIANSRFTRSEAVAMGADPMKIHVVPVGAPDPVRVEADEVERMRAQLGGGRIVLSVARLEPHKGHDVLIDSLAHLPADVRMVIVGDGATRDDLTVRAAPYGDRVVFAGSVSDGELPVYFAAADCFAALSLATAAGVEGGGIAVLEACAYGLPIVAAASGGIPETINDNETGLLVTPGDVRATARSIARIFEDATLAKRLGQAACALATTERSWTRSVERIEEVLELAVAPR